MPQKTEPREGEEAAARFTRLVKKVVSVPKSEIDRRAKEWRETRADEKRETANNLRRPVTHLNKLSLRSVKYIVTLSRLGKRLKLKRVPRRDDKIAFVPAGT